jgi:AAA domain
LLHEGETILLAGRGKVGKSRLVQQMSLSIVTGSDFLGMRIPQCRRVLIIDLENRVPVVRDRMMRMAGANTPLPGWFVWCSSSLSDETVDCSEHGIERLRCMVEQTRADVLVIDPWRLFLGRDENNAEDIVNGLKRLSRLRTTHPRLAILIVHHVRKDRFESPRNLLTDPRLWTDAVSGHHALSSHVDACYGLERQRDEESGDELIVFGGVARNTEPRTILLEDDEETLLFSVEHSEAALDALLTKAERPIWETAKLLGQFAFNKLQVKANTKNKKAISSVLKKAKAQGLLRHENKSYTVISD